jgi:hypothetical protein
MNKNPSKRKLQHQTYQTNILFPNKSAHKGTLAWHEENYYVRINVHPTTIPFFCESPAQLSHTCDFANDDGKYFKWN